MIQGLELRGMEEIGHAACFHVMEDKARRAMREKVKKMQLIRRVID